MERSAWKNPKWKTQRKAGVGNKITQQLKVRNNIVHAQERRLENNQVSIGTVVTVI